MSKGTLEQELQKIHEAGIGISITWLWDGGVDLRLVHKTGVVAAEGNVNTAANVVSWLEGAIRMHFPNANYEQAVKPLPGTPRSTSFMPRDYTVNRERITDGGAQ
jgi:hypothetical protein